MTLSVSNLIAEYYDNIVTVTVYGSTGVPLNIFLSWFSFKKLKYEETTHIHPLHVYTKTDITWNDTKFIYKVNCIYFT